MRFWTFPLIAFFSAIFPGIPAGSALASDCNEVFEQAFALVEGYQELPKSIPQSLQFEIYAVSYPGGEANGPVYHFRVRDDLAHQIAAVEGVHLQNTEFNETTRGFFEFFGFKVKTHPTIGKYWSEAPSPEYFESKRAEWNALVGNDPLLKIVFNYKTTGADNQITMLKLFLDNYTLGMASPFAAYTDFYIPTGKAGRKAEDNDKIITKPDGRVDDNVTLYAHDLPQMVNSFFMPEAPLAKNQEVEKFLSEAYQILKLENAALPPVTAQGITELLKSYDHYQRGDGKASNVKKGDGMDPLKYFLLNLYFTQRGLHGLTHILTLLINHPEGLDPNTYRLTDHGYTAETEVPLHIASLGIISKGSTAPGDSPLLTSLWARGSDSSGPLTLEKAFNYITNVEAARAKEIVDRIGSPALKALYEKYRQQGAFDPVSTETLGQWAQTTRDRYAQMGRGMQLGR